MGADAVGAVVGKARQPALTPYLRRGSSEAMQRENIADPVKYLFSILPSSLNRSIALARPASNFCSQSSAESNARRCSHRSSGAFSSNSITPGILGGDNKYQP